MTATAEAAAFRSRIQHQRRASRLPQRMYFLSTAELVCKRATLALLARRATAARDRYEAAFSLSFPATDAFRRHV